MTPRARANPSRSTDANQVVARSPAAPTSVNRCARGDRSDSVSLTSKTSAAGLAWLGTSFGHDAFLLGHHWIGAIGVLALFALALFLTVRIAIGGITRPSARFTPATTDDRN